LFHATFGPLLPSIYQYGIGDSKRISVINFPASESGVYLAKNPQMANDFVECTENEELSDKWWEDIVVLKIDTSKLNKGNFIKDPHFNMEDINPNSNDASVMESFLYKGIIPASAIVGEMSL
jgi:hypothetical protein